MAKDRIDFEQVKKDTLEKATQLDHEPTEADLAQLMQEFIQEHQEELISSLNHKVTEENAEDASDYLELAAHARSKKKRLEYLQKGAELEPDNLDVLAVTALIKGKDALAIVDDLAKVVKKGKQQMRDAGYFKHAMGEFWHVLDTRPYMRGLQAYMENLIACDMYSQAINVGEYMLKLCEDDNLGIRFALMHLYVFREDEMHALRLARRNREEAEWRSVFLLPLSILYFKLGDRAKAEKYLRQLQENNRDLKKFLRLAVTDEVYTWDLPNMKYGYQPGTGSELVMQYELYPFLMQDSAWAFYKWAKEKLTVHRKRKTKAMPEKDQKEVTESESSQKE